MSFFYVCLASFLGSALCASIVGYLIAKNLEIQQFTDNIEEIGYPGHEETYDISNEVVQCEDCGKVFREHDRMAVLDTPDGEIVLCPACAKKRMPEIRKKNIDGVVEMVQALEPAFTKSDLKKIAEKILALSEK